MPLEASSNLVVGQWLDSPRLRAAIDALLAAAEEDALDAFERLQLMRHIDTAEGVWLDYLGARVGLRRPATTDPEQDTRFGFDGPGSGFDQVPFRGARESEAVFPMGDEQYRCFIRARGILVLGDGTTQTFAKAVRCSPATT